MAQEYHAANCGLLRPLRWMPTVLVLKWLRNTVVDKEHVFIKTFYLWELIAASAIVIGREDVIRFYVHVKVAFLVNFSKCLGDLYPSLKNALDTKFVCVKGALTASSRSECERITKVQERFAKFLHTEYVIISLFPLLYQMVVIRRIWTSHGFQNIWFDHSVAGAKDILQNHFLRMCRTRSIVGLVYLTEATCLDQCFV